MAPLCCANVDPFLHQPGLLLAVPNFPSDFLSAFWSFRFLFLFPNGIVSKKDGKLLEFSIILFLVPFPVGKGYLLGSPHPCVHKWEKGEVMEGGGR